MKAKANESDVSIALVSVKPMSIVGELYIRYDTETLSIATTA